MDKYAEKILSRIYQSYVTGGDTYTYQFKTEDPFEIELNRRAIHALEEEGYLEVISVGNKKARLAITDKGIEYGNNNC